MGLFTKTKRTPHTAPSAIEAAQPIAPEQPTAKPKRKETRLGSLFMGDRVIWVVFFFLCIISLVEVYSAASTLAYKSGRFLGSPSQASPIPWCGYLYRCHRTSHTLSPL